MGIRGSGDALGRSVARVIRIQVALGLTLVVGALIWSQPTSALAAACGTALGVLGTMLSARGVTRASRRVGADSTPSVMPLYLGEIQKLLIIGAGVGFGLVILGLDAMFLLVGLALSQVGYVVASVLSLAGDR
jgi:hypothetical protein